MASLFSVNSWTDLKGNVLSSAAAISINPANIVSVRTIPAKFGTGVTEILYSNPVNNDRTQAYLYVTQTAAAVLASTNATGLVGSSGRATLVAGTVTVSVPGLTAANNVVVSMLTPGTPSLTTEYQAVAGTDSIVIRANVAAGTINSADTSTLVFAVVG